MNAFSIVDRVFGYVDASLKAAVAPLAPYLRRLGFGITLVVLSALGWIAALVFYLLAFFLSLSDQGRYVAPALWTGSVGLGIGLLFLIFGLNLLRKPR